MCYVCEDCAFPFKLQSTLLVNCEDYMAKIPIGHTVGTSETTTSTIDITNSPITHQPQISDTTRDTKFLTIPATYPPETYFAGPRVTTESATEVGKFATTTTATTGPTENNSSKTTEYQTTQNIESTTQIAATTDPFVESSHRMRLKRSLHRSSESTIYRCYVNIETGKKTFWNIFSLKIIPVYLSSYSFFGRTCTSNSRVCAQRDPRGSYLPDVLKVLYVWARHVQ